MRDFSIPIMFTLSFQFKTSEETNVTITCSNIRDKGTVALWDQSTAFLLTSKKHTNKQTFTDNNTDFFHGTLRADEPG